jgi:hypothetical protein
VHCSFVWRRILCMPQHVSELCHSQTFPIQQDVTPSGPLDVVSSKTHEYYLWENCRNLKSKHIYSACTLKWKLKVLSMILNVYSLFIFRFAGYTVEGHNCCFCRNYTDIVLILRSFTTQNLVICTSDSKITRRTATATNTTIVMIFSTTATILLLLLLLLLLF